MNSFVNFNPRTAGEVTFISIIFSLNVSLPRGYKVVIRLAGFGGNSTHDLKLAQEESSDPFICSWNQNTRTLIVKKQDGIPAGTTAFDVLAQNGISLPLSGLQANDSAVMIGVTLGDAASSDNVTWSPVTTSPATLPNSPRRSARRILLTQEELQTPVTLPYTTLNFQESDEWLAVKYSKRIMIFCVAMMFAWNILTCVRIPSRVTDIYDGYRKHLGCCFAAGKCVSHTENKV